MPVCPGPLRIAKTKNAPRRCTGLVSTRRAAELCFVHLRRPPCVEGPSSGNQLESPAHNCRSERCSGEWISNNRRSLVLQGYGIGGGPTKSGQLVLGRRSGSSFC